MRWRSAIVAVIVGAIFLVLALSPSLYALTVKLPTPLHGIAAVMRQMLEPLVPTMRSALSDSGWRSSDLVRKAYSILAFAVLGYIIARSMRSRRFSSRLHATMTLVAGFSAIIEILQRQGANHESWISSLLDIACGGIGGITGTVVQERVNR